MERFVLTDAQWANMESHCLGRRTDTRQSRKDNRLFLEAVQWIVRTGSPWRDLPAMFGNWSTTFRRFRDWYEVDVFKRIFDVLLEAPGMEYPMVDASIVKVHRHGQGAKRGLRARPLAVPKGA
ncbi:IS5 family transposase [Sphingobium sp. MK2]|uniref:IS5 family transposase n=1 Tax=Sphingobium sp. MK2 TaxID=3116540 RepID=UPI003868E4AE